VGGFKLPGQAVVFYGWESDSGGKAQRYADQAHGVLPGLKKRIRFVRLLDQGFLEGEGLEQRLAYGLSVAR
jgi:hypothetical protein